MRSPVTAAAFAPFKPRTGHAGMGYVEFVALMAAIMATGALGIDAMLPALPVIGQALGVTDANQRQWIVTAYVLGMGAAQLPYGPLADRWGRKPVLIIGLGIYTVFGVVAAFANSFETLLVARALQGMGAACSRVLTVSIVRDCYEGNPMARVMSLSFMVFLAVPILAPSVGQLVMMIAPWPWVFSVLALFGLVVLLWVALRLPETLAVSARRPIEWTTISEAFAVTVRDRQSMGYTLASTVLIGALFGFINSSQQLFVDVFHAGTLFPVMFAAIASSVAAASLLNARIVERLGMRRVAHGAMIGFALLGCVHALVALAGAETLWRFALLQAGMMFCFGLTIGNFGAMAMDRLGHVAGMASSVQGFISNFVGAIVGFLVGQQFDGTALPLALSYAVLGLVALVVVLVTERGALFRIHAADSAGPVALAAH